MVNVVTLDYEDLVKKKDLTEDIEKAYGKDGLGILLVNNVPNLVKFRKELLPLSKKFGEMDEKVKAKYEDKESTYSFGWSFGKEKFKGVYDTKKGSYYNNPVIDEPTKDESLIKKYAPYCSKNIWPTEEIPEFEKSFKKLGQLIVDVGTLVTVQCDKYVAKKNKSYESGRLLNVLKGSKCHKGRLLYYFPNKKKVDTNEKKGDWCGWHLDHDTITGLTRALYQNDEGKEVENKDSGAGLFIRNRKGEVVKATWKYDQLAFQIGESSQIHSGGELVATPHCVRGTNEIGISRSTLAVFMQPNWDEKLDMPKGASEKDVNVHLFEKGMDFHDFSLAKFKEYYS